MNAWRRSIACGASVNCAEVRTLPDGSVEVRDSKNPDTVLRYDAAAWAAFLAGVKRGEFDQPTTTERDDQ